MSEKQQSYGEIKQEIQKMICEMNPKDRMDYAKCISEIIGYVNQASNALALWYKTMSVLNAVDLETYQTSFEGLKNAALSYIEYEKIFNVMMTEKTKKTNINVTDDDKSLGYLS